MLRHNVFRVHPGFSTYQNFIPFYGWVIFHRMAITHFVYPFISWWSFGLSPLLVIINNAAVNIHIQVFIYLGVELMYHIVDIWGTAYLFCKVATAFYNHTSCIWGSDFFTSSLIIIINCLFFFSHSSGYDMVSRGLIYISLMTKDDEHPFMGLLVIYISPLEKCL